MTTHPPTLGKPGVAAAATEHDALPPGTRFGEFEIIRVLGVGGFGIVYLAKDHSLERDVALKEYMPASLAARGAGPQITVRSSSFAETYAIGLRSFINEARLLARFDHPSLVKVYRFWEDNATAYMVMPFLQGVTLRDTRRGMAHAPDEAWTRSVISPILSALELLHREGVYHRDIAPDNILLPREGPPVLLDFGAARRVISDRTQSLTAILKPSYAPIEQYAEMTQLRQGPWTDLYALGAVVHYLLFGAPPAPATARAVQDDADAIESRSVPGVSPRFLEAMSWMLAVRPNQRPQSVEQLRAVLDGQAEIPPRGRATTTIPGAVVRPMATPVAPPRVEQAFDATLVNTAQAPTYMPTARVAPPSAAAATTFSPTAPMPTARIAPPGDATIPRPPAFAPMAPTQAVPAARLAPLGSAGAAPNTRPGAIPAPLSRPVPLVAQAGSAPLEAAAKPSKVWLALAAGGVVVAIVAFAAWQFSARRDSGAVEQASAASAPASSSVAVPTPGAAPTPVPTVVAPAVTSDTSTNPVAATALPSTSADESRAARARPVPSTMNATTTTEPNLHPPTGDRLAATPTIASASSARARPPGRPVPRVDDAPTAAATVAAPRPGMDTMAPQPSSGSNLDRSRPAIQPPPIVAQRPTSTALPVPVPTGPASAREACGKRVFIALAVCMDERCEEPRFRNTAECAPILARKSRRGSD